MKKICECSRKKYWGKGKVIEQIINIIKLSKKKVSILEIGCGEGYILYTIYNAIGFKNIERIVGIDIDARTIDRARDINKNIEYHVYDISEEEWLKSLSDFDLIISINVHEIYSNDEMFSYTYDMLNKGM